MIAKETRSEKASFISVLILVVFLLSACSSPEKKAPESGRVDEAIQGRRAKLLQYLDRKEDVLSKESLDRSLMDSVPRGSDNENSVDLLRVAALCAKGRVKEGLSEIREKVRWQPNHQTWTVLGNCYLRHGRTKLAILHFKQALAAKKNFVPAINNLAVAELGLGHQGIALAGFKEALDQGAFHRVPRWNLAKFYLNWRLYKKALSHFKSLHRVAPKDKEVGIGLAMAYQGTGDLQRAKSLYERYQTENRDRPDFLLNYALLLNKLKQEQKAARLARRVLAKMDFFEDELERREAQIAANYLIQQGRKRQSGRGSKPQL
jgi:Tfp pilus assembly protein PilF